MTRKEAVDLLLSKVSADKKDAFIEELRNAKTTEERHAVAKKYGATLTEEEFKAFKDASSNKLSDEELDDAAGGCGESNGEPKKPLYNCGCGCV